MPAILIADDHSIVRAGIKGIIEDNFTAKRIDEASTENEIVQLVKSNYYNLILLDINIPGIDFIQIMHWLKVSAPHSAILIFTMHPATIYGKRCFQLGAKGFLNKKTSNNEIITAIKKILEGKQYITDEMNEILAQSNNETDNPFLKLSPRELEIALLLKNEHSLPQICNILNIQYSTANTHKRRIFEKLNVQNVLSLSALMKLFNIEY